MLATCANPSCSASWLNLGEGRIFRLEAEPETNPTLACPSSFGVGLPGKTVFLALQWLLEEGDTASRPRWNSRFGGPPGLRGSKSRGFCHRLAVCGQALEKRHFFPPQRNRTWLKYHGIVDFIEAYNPKQVEKAANDYLCL